MKYLIFFIAFMGVLPLGYILTLNRKYMRYAFLAVLLPVMMFNQVSINFFSHETYRGTSRGMEVSLVYLIALAMITGMLILYHKKPFMPDGGSKIYWIYFLLCLPSLINADNTLFSWFELGKMIMMYIVFICTYYYLYNTRDFSTVMIGFGIVATVTFCSVVLQHLKGIHQANGLFPHQNSMGMFMNLIAPIFFSYYFNVNKGWKRFLFAGFFLMASAACMRTYSRGAMVCLPFGCAITTLLSLRYQFHMRKIQILLPIFLLCFFGLLLLLPNIIKRFENAPRESLMTRQYLAASAWNMMCDKPFAGVGLNNWGIKINPPYPYCEYRYENKRIAKDFKEGIVETSYLLVGAECGFLALAAFLSWLGYYYIAACKLVKRLRRTNLFYIPSGIVGGLTAVYLQSTLEWVMKQQVNFIQMMILFAALSILYKYNGKFVSGEVEAAI
ncbi:MAG: O-antigen ligase family protein [Lentisphaeria bacterium]|nr:O-antigen ligase family protein [Lentisphaeria bacterium]